ncbi:EDD domain protein, DegV family [Acetoanaerobium noterae]|uniref:EDD domain protein, DegV family n=1 Tax=Acetoanaerobium noterae TaxID=745369 RepID=A0A1T5BFU5_9FIRM|nr:DegV family protein [Acetoanaerobium noterae]SKB46025.1 EDD domain protein, DegV family [Acetoanaerobium noterae]
MRDYIIVTDATSDIPNEMANELNVKVVPMSFSLGEKNYNHYPDYRELDIKTFYDKQRAGQTSLTTQINVAVYLDFFEEIIKSDKEVLYISFSSALSSTYQSSVLAAKELNEKYPDFKIITIDSKAATLGETLLVKLAAQKKSEGMNIEDLSKWVDDNHLKVCHYFTVDDLNHLKRGGRMTAMTAFIGTALDIKPILHVNDEGKLIPLDKVRGRKKALKVLFNYLAELSENLEEQTIFIGHGDCIEDARYLESLIKEAYKVKEVIIHPIGPIIGSHTGPGAITLFFLGKHR